MTKLTILSLENELNIQSQCQIHGGDLNQYSEQKITSGGRVVTSAYIGVDAGDSGYNAITFIAQPGEAVPLNLKDFIGKGIAVSTPSNVTFSFS